MVFSSEFFLYGFMPVFFSLYYLRGDRWKNQIILAASLIFYLIGAGSTVVLLLLSIGINQFLAVRIAPAELGRRQVLLSIGVIINIATLGYYKYGTFIWQLASNAADFLELENFPAPPFIPLPLGISFFTFQAVSYLVDVYRREVPPARSYAEFATLSFTVSAAYRGPNRPLSRDHAGNVQPVVGLASFDGRRLPLLPRSRKEDGDRRQSRRDR
jgi:alginate O-acetyltransferase complex protein AlgI